MRTINYILVLLFVFTTYLFSQSERNEQKKVDTVIVSRIDTVVITSVDTVIVDEFVLETSVVIKFAGDQEKKLDVTKYDFYNHGYLDYLKKTSPNDDKVVADDCKRTGMISAKLGIGLFMGALSFSLDIPIGCNNTIIPKYISAGGGMNDANFKSSFIGLGVGGVTKRTENLIVKINVCAGVMSDLDEGKNGIGSGMGIDVLFKMFKPCYFSIGTDIIGGRYGFIGVISLGINIVY